MTVLTGNRRKNMPVCFLRHTILYEMLECRVHVKVILMIPTEKEKAFVSSKVVTVPVQACRLLQAKFYNTFKNFQNQTGTNSATIHVKNSGWSASTFQDLPKKKKTKSNVDTAKLFILLQ